MGYHSLVALGLVGSGGLGLAVRVSTHGGRIQGGVGYGEESVGTEGIDFTLRHPKA
jgi:hypothetical protein